VTPERIAYVSRIVAGRAQLRSARVRVSRCRDDGGAAGRVTLAPGALAAWQDRPSVSGQARIAAAEWAAIAGWVGRA